jgi:uncharacterized membrane protein YecN with MAPEG domain
VSGSTSTTQIVAIAAAAVAVIALLWALSLTVALSRLRAAQRIVLGEGSEDLVGHAAGLSREFRSLDADVRDSLARFDARILAVEARLDGAVAYRSLVRYDAYGEMSGHQSTSIALLDATRSGIVVSSIHHRDQARLYVKQIHAGRPDLELSPEEADAVRLALGGERRPEPEDRGVAEARVRVRRPRG